MKIVIFSRFPADASKPGGGVETATLGLVRGLKAIDCGEVHVVTIEKTRKARLVETVEGITVHRLAGNKWPMVFDILFGPGKKQLQQYIASLKPDIVHFQETYGLGVTIKGIPSLFTVHGFDSLNLRTEKPRFWFPRSLLWALVERICMRRQTTIISITPYVRDEIEAITRAKIYDIDNAISEKYFKLEKIPVDVKRIFFAGWLNPRKNALTLIKAFAKVLAQGTDAELFLAGEATVPWYFEKIREEIGKHSIDDKVHILGRISQDAVRDNLCRATIFVLPSYQENAPMAIAEAMAVGIPVISSNLCGMPYMIKNNQSGFLIDPDNVDQLADIMNKLLTNKQLRDSVVEQAKIEARNRYHPHAVANKTVDVYKKLIHKYG